MVQRGMSASILYCMQNEGLVDNYYLAHYSIDTINMF